MVGTRKSNAKGRAIAKRLAAGRKKSARRRRR